LAPWTTSTDTVMRSGLALNRDSVGANLVPELRAGTTPPRCRSRAGRWSRVPGAERGARRVFDEEGQQPARRAGIGFGAALCVMSEPVTVVLRGSCRVRGYASCQ